MTDLPGNEWRRIQRSEGYRCTLVHGAITFEDGEHAGAMSGKLLRHGKGERRTTKRVGGQVQPIGDLLHGRHEQRDCRPAQRFQRWLKKRYSIGRLANKKHTQERKKLL